MVKNNDFFTSEIKTETVYIQAYVNTLIRFIVRVLVQSEIGRTL